MERAIRQLPIEKKMNHGLAQSSMEDMPEFVFFQKLLILQREFMNMDLRDFLMLVPKGQEQTESFCFSVAQGIFSHINKYQQAVQSKEKYDKILNDRQAIFDFGLKIRDVKQIISQIEEKVIVRESLRDEKLASSILSEKQISNLKKDNRYSSIKASEDQR